MLPRIAMLCLLLAGCAGAPPQVPKVERISAEELEARLPQPASAVSLADIVVMSRTGIPPATIAARLREAAARHRLSATQLLELHDQGVAREVLDYMVESERRAIFEDMATELAKREQACEQRVRREVGLCRLQMQSLPPYWPHHPLGGCWPPHPGYPF